MKQIIEFPLGNNQSVFVEVDTAESAYRGAGEGEVSRPGKLIQKASQTFQDALSVVKPVAESLIGKLTNLAQRPSEIAVEFGIKLSADAGVLIVASGVEANFKVTLKWVTKR